MLLLIQRVGADELGTFQFGLMGIVNITAGTVDKNVVAIQALADTVITSATELNATGSIDGVTLSAGTIVYGNFTQVVVASGQARLYLGDN